MKVFCFGFLCFSFLLAACAAPVEDQITVTRVEKTAVLGPPTSLPATTPTLLPTATPASSASATFSPAPTRTRRPTLTPIPLNTPTPKPPPTLLPDEFLTVRQPFLEQVDDYLKGLPEDYFYNVDTFYPDLSIEFFQDEGLSEIAQLLHVDVNGDGEDDLIVTDESLLAIFLWQGEQYAPPFVVIGYWGSSNSRTEFEDWTGDGTPEVIFQYLEPYHWGTGLQRYDWAEFIIDCRIDECHIIWEYTPAFLNLDYNFGGMFLTRSDIQLQTDEQGNILLQQTKTGFQVYYLGGGLGYNEPDLSDSLAIFTSTLSIYQWNGASFNLIAKDVLSNYQVIDSYASLEADSVLGNATILFEPNYGASENNDVCQLTINTLLIGKAFGCKGNFATADWQDVTGDEQLEIVIQVLSGANPHDKEWNELADIGCVHQRLLIYQWDGETAAEIANVAGCVVQADLYGVRLEDWDGDGQVEILAASGWFTEEECNPDGSWVCWQEFGYQNQVYKWNGETFALWTTVALTSEP